MMYRRDRPTVRKANPSARKLRRPTPAMVTLVLVLLLTAGAIFGFNHRNTFHGDVVAIFDPSEAGANIHHHHGNTIERNRLLREYITPLDINTISYAKLFNDTNSTQLDAAIRNGLKNPDLVTDPAKSSELMLIGSNSLYVVDTMWFAKPYLVPEAVLLMAMIGERFQEVMAEHYPDYQHVRPIVTSALRTTSSVRQLRRFNRNASDSSCHIYGTTVDISYTRFLTDSGDYAQEYFLKPMLAVTLYELREEGLIFVKHERHQACFHLTLRTTSYQGSKPSKTRTYKAPRPWESGDRNGLAARAKEEPQSITTTVIPKNTRHRNIRHSAESRKATTQHNDKAPEAKRTTQKSTQKANSNQWQIEPAPSPHRRHHDDPRAETVYGGLIDDDSYIAR